MRILQVCPGAYMPGYGGISEHVRNISSRLAVRHDVTVYATNPGALPRRETLNGVKVERFERLAPGDAYFFSPAMLVKLMKAEFDVVHGHGYHAFPMHYAAMAKHKRLVVTTHFHGAGHTTFRNSLFEIFKPLGSVTLHLADRVIAVSEFERSLLQSSFGLSQSKIEVIPNGIDYSQIVGLRHLDGQRSLLYVGRLERYKGVQHIVEAMPKLDDDIHLDLVGKGSLRQSLENRAKQLGLDNRVQFFEDLPRRVLMQKYADADLFILLSEYEAYSLVVAEALASGTPCLVANTSALTEWIDNRICFGIDVPIELDKLADSINHALERGVDDRSSGLNVRKKILDWDEVVEKIERIYAG